MPIHDWTRVEASIWHDFHGTWNNEIRDVLNAGLLPADFYALSEQVTLPFAPDVLTLQVDNSPQNGSSSPPHAQGIALATTAPRTRYSAETEPRAPPRTRRSIVIHHNSGDRVVAVIELLSPGNKSSRRAFQRLIHKATELLLCGCHLLVVDLFPPTRRDPAGVHAAIWRELSGDSFQPPPDEPLTLAAYAAGESQKAFVEPTAVGRALIDMPLFLEPDVYINIPLESTYEAAYRKVPHRWRAVLDA